MKFFLVKGRVQGVGFRYFAKTKAEALGLSGFVANLPNGAVCVAVKFEEGASQNYHAFLKLLAQGPHSAAVEAVLPLKQNQLPSRFKLLPASLRGFVILP